MKSGGDDVEMSEKNSKLLLIGCLIAGTALLHYGTPHHLMYVHIALQSLFFVPVYLSGTWFGKRGGLIASIAVGAVYIHHAVTVMMPTNEMAVGNSIQILLLFVVGFLVGAYADIKRGYQTAIHDSKSYTTASFPEEQSLLVYVDDSAASMNAVRYAAAMFGRRPDVKVTLLSVLSKTNPDFFRTAEEHAKEQAKTVESGRGAVEKARQLVLDAGLPEVNIGIRFAHSEGTRTSDVIIHEQESGNYSAIIVGRHPLSRAEEFLFGNVAVRLAREARRPVWVIEGENAVDKVGEIGQKNPVNLVNPVR